MVLIADYKGVIDTGHDKRMVLEGDVQLRDRYALEFLNKLSIKAEDKSGEESSLDFITFMFVNT